MRARLSVCALAAVAALVFAPLAARAQTAAEIVDTGWWTQNPVPNAPPGGFEVSQGPQGPLSVAAIHIRVEATALTQGVLTISESQVVGTPVLQVCPTTSAWTPASGGAYSAAPTPDCRTSVPMVRNAASATDTADIRKLAGSGPTTLSLMIVPVTDASLPLQLPFDATFGSASLLADGDVNPEPAASAAAGDSGSSSASAGSGFGSDLSTTGVAPSPDLGATPFPALATTPPPAEQQAAAAPSQEVGRFPATGQAGLPKGTGDHKPWGRAWVFAFVALAVGAVTAFGRRWLVTRGWLETT